MVGGSYFLSWTWFWRMHLPASTQTDTSEQAGDETDRRTDQSNSHLPHLGVFVPPGRDTTKEDQNTAKEHQRINKPVFRLSA